MRSRDRRPGAPAAALLAVTLAAGCAMREGQTTGARAPAASRSGLSGQEPSAPAGPEETRPIPFEGALAPKEPPPPAAPLPRQLLPGEKEALATLYQRPAPMGPPPIPREPAAAISVVGRGPVIRQLPGPPAFADKMPPELVTAEGDHSMFANHMVRLPRGEVRFVAVDRTKNDTKLSRDSMEFEASITDEEGHDWKIVQLALAPLSPNLVADPWYGGLAIDITEHGMTMRGHPGEPLLNCAMCSWGWADIWKDGRKVASSAPLHVMLSSDVHNDADNFNFGCYDCTGQPVREVHVVVDASANLPTSGGFLHVMWENAESVRGSPEEIQAKAAEFATKLPTLELNAVPHLRWSKTVLEVPVGRPVRLVLNNRDPSSFHAFMVRGPDGEVLVPLPQGEQWVTSLAFAQPGEYEFWCPVSNHRNHGMYGRIIVGGGVPGGTEGPPGGRRP